MNVDLEEIKTRSSFCCVSLERLRLRQAAAAWISIHPLPPPDNTAILHGAAADSRPSVRRAASCGGIRTAAACLGSSLCPCVGEARLKPSFRCSVPLGTAAALPFMGRVGATRTLVLVCDVSAARLLSPPCSESFLSAVTSCSHGHSRTQNPGNSLPM